MTDSTHDSARIAPSTISRASWTIVLLLIVGGVILAAGRRAADSPFAEVHVHRDWQSFLPDTEPPLTPEEFDRYIAMQVKLVRSPLVVVAALRNPSVAPNRLLAGDVPAQDWLEEHLEVSIVNEEFLRVSLRDVDPEHSTDAARLVNAVVKAYLREEVAQEGAQRRQRLTKLQEMFERRRRELEVKQSRLAELSEQVRAHSELSVSDEEFAKLVQAECAQVRFAILQHETTVDETGDAANDATQSEELARMRTRLVRVQAELDKLDGAAQRNHLFSSEVERLQDDIKLSESLAQRINKEIEEIEINIQNSSERVTVHREAVSL